MRKMFHFLILLFLINSCIKETNPVRIGSSNTYLTGPGVFIMNEGNFRVGNGSLSFFSYDSAKIYNNVFFDVNQRPLGDIPYSMNIHADKGYILVNNSGKIEVVNRTDMKSLATISGLQSPRYITFISDSKAYVSSLYSDSLAIIDLSSDKISGYINIKKTSETLVTLYSRTYVANWFGGNKIIVINAANDQVTDSIEVGYEPESMVIDKNETLWVLCNGGYMREHFAELIAIDTRTNKIDKRFTFPSIADSPTCLQIDKDGGTLYYILGGIRMMKIDASGLPTLSYISDTNHSFYKIGVNPDNNEIFASDPADYVQKGTIMRYSSEGVLRSSLQADIIPGGFCFKTISDSEIN